MDQFIVQPFLPSGRGIKAGKALAASSPDAARTTAERMGAQCGAAALHIEVDEDTGVTKSVKVLARVGTLPDDFDETVGA